MRNVLIYIGVAIVLGVLGILVAAFVKPKEYRLERSVSTSASAAEVFRVLNDIQRFQEWSPWKKLDPEAKYEYSGPLLGVGSAVAWDGNKDLGAGRMQIVDTQPEKAIFIETEFFRPFASKSRTSWLVSDEGSQRKITWVMEGINETIIARVFNVIVSMDKILGKDFEEGLASLKSIVEKN